jgi:hypothetical protein
MADEMENHLSAGGVFMQSRPPRPEVPQMLQWYLEPIAGLLLFHSLTGNGKSVFEICALIAQA